MLFPRVYIQNISPLRRDLISRAVRWENFARSQYSKWVTQTWRKMAQFSFIRAWYSYFMFGGCSTYIRDVKKSFVMSSLLKSWQIYNCLRFLVNRISVELFVMFCAIWYYLYNLKNVKNAHGGVLFLVKLQAFSLQLY